MRVKHAAILLVAGFILMPTVLWSQPGGLGGPPGGFGGGGGMGGGGAFSRINPDQLFDLFAKGQDVIRVESLDQGSRAMFDRFGARFGITGSQITREQFRDSFNKIKEMAASGQLPQVTGANKFEGNMDRMFDSRFNDMDRNHDGVLSHDELNGHQLQDERDRYDANGDGFIDLNEYKSYATARMGPMGGPQQGGPGGRDRDREDADEPRRPVMYRAGNLPRDFPYASLDENGDKDGQVGLYEWKNAGKRISEFQDLDLNKDGFLTVDEYYRYRRQHMPQVASTSLFGDVPDPATMMANGRGGPGRDMRGPGGDMGRGPGGGMDFRGMMGMDGGRGMYAGMGGPGFGPPPGMNFDMSRGRDGGRDGGRDRDRERGPGGRDSFGGDPRMSFNRGEGGGPTRMMGTPGGDGNGTRTSFAPGGGGMSFTPGGGGTTPGGGMFPGSGMSGRTWNPGGGMTPGGGAMVPGMTPGGMGNFRDRGGMGGPGSGGTGMGPPGGGKRDWGGGPGGGGPGGRDRGGEGGGKRDFGGGGPRPR
jgi:hypothetical protein